MGVHVVNGAGHDIKKRSNTIDSSTFGILGYTSFITYCRSEISKWEFRMSHDALVHEFCRLRLMMTNRKGVMKDFILLHVLLFI